jgi:hypothetical protein
MSICVQVGRIDQNGNLEISNYWTEKEDFSDIVSEITSRDTYFRITEEEELETWHDIVRDEWSAQDDDIYYNFEAPNVSTTNWYGYKDGYLYILKNLIKSLEKSLDRARSFSSKSAYMNQK